MSVRSPTPCALKIADKIAEQFESAVLLMVRMTENKGLMKRLNVFYVYGTGAFVGLMQSVCFCLFLKLDGSKMSPDDRVPPIVMYERRDSKWILKDKHT